MRAAHALADHGLGGIILLPNYSKENPRALPKEMEHRSPESFTIVGFREITFALLVKPPLTTIHVDKKIGQRATTCLFEQPRSPFSSYSYRC